MLPNLTRLDASQTTKRCAKKWFHGCDVAEPAAVEGEEGRKDPFGEAGQQEAGVWGGSGIQPLPPASQIDASVLDALPLQMKREIERAYGEGRV